MVSLKEQWNRALRYRDRYVEALALMPADLILMETIPEDRKNEIATWANDCQDFGVSCCQQLHHLKDWACRDATLGLDRRGVEELISNNAVLRVVADICNGTKHAELDRPRSAVVDPAGVSRMVRLVGSPDGASGTAHHRVVVGTTTRWLEDIIEEAIEVWTGFFKQHGIWSGDGHP